LNRVATARSIAGIATRLARAAAAAAIHAVAAGSYFKRVPCALHIEPSFIQLPSGDFSAAVAHAAAAQEELCVCFFASVCYVSAAPSSFEAVICEEVARKQYKTILRWQTIRKFRKLPTY
jgi:hypothetical protein